MKPEGVNTDILVTIAFLVLNKSKTDHNTGGGGGRRKPEPEAQKITVILEISVKNFEFLGTAAYICSLYLCNTPSGKIKSLPTVRKIKI